MDAPSVVVKVGGSLLGWSGFPASLRRYLDGVAPARSVLVVGGGKGADFLRELDSLHGIGDNRAHALAVRMLDVTARVVAAVVPGVEVVEGIGELAGVWERGRTPVLSPGRLLETLDGRRSDPLPACWDVTTDSIAARVAELLGASTLVLLKSTGPDAPIGRTEAARRGVVDPFFPRAAAPLDRVVLVNLRAEIVADVPLTRDNGRRADRNRGARDMAKTLVTPLDREGVAPRAISPRLRSQLNYFVAAPGGPDAPAHVDNEYWFDADEVRRWVEDGVILLVSPLDTAHATEVELSEEQEEFLGWLAAHGVTHVRVSE